MAENTKQRIIAAAIELFSTKGYAGTSMNDIIEKVDKSKGSVYWHFTSKEEIYLSAVRESFEQWFDLVERELAGVEDPLEKLRAYSRVFISTVDIPTWRLTPESYWTEFSEQTRSELDELLAKDDDIVCDILKEGMECGLLRADDTAKLTWVYFSLVEGMFEKVVFAYRHAPKTRPALEGYAAEAVEAFIDAIRA